MAPGDLRRGPPSARLGRPRRRRRQGRARVRVERLGRAVTVVDPRTMRLGAAVRRFRAGHYHRNHAPSVRAPATVHGGHGSRPHVRRRAGPRRPQARATAQRAAPRRSTRAGRSLHAEIASRRGTDLTQGRTMWVKATKSRRAARRRRRPRACSSRCAGRSRPESARARVCLRARHLPSTVPSVARVSSVSVRRLDQIWPRSTSASSLIKPGRATDAAACARPSGRLPATASRRWTLLVRRSSVFADEFPMVAATAAVSSFLFGAGTPPRGGALLHVRGVPAERRCRMGPSGRSRRVAPGRRRTPACPTRAGDRARRTRAVRREERRSGRSVRRSEEDGARRRGIARRLRGVSRGGGLDGAVTDASERASEEGGGARQWTRPRRPLMMRIEEVEDALSGSRPRPPVGRV